MILIVLTLITFTAAIGGRLDAIEWTGIEPIKRSDPMRRQKAGSIGRLDVTEHRDRAPGRDLLAACGGRAR